MLKTAANGGFTIVELLVAMSILALMMAIGIPSLSSYLQVAKLASAANSYHAGMQSGASRGCSTQPDRRIRDDQQRRSIPETIANNVVPAVAGVNWIVRAPDPDCPGHISCCLSRSRLVDGAGGGNAVIQASGIEFAGRLQRHHRLQWLRSAGAQRNGPGASFSIDLSNPTGGQCVGAGAARCVAHVVRVSTGGQISNCDPAAAASDTRSCPP